MLFSFVHNSYKDHNPILTHKAMNNFYYILFNHKLKISGHQKLFLTFSTQFHLGKVSLYEEWHYYSVSYQPISYFEDSNFIFEGALFIIHQKTGFGKGTQRISWLHQPICVVKYKILSTGINVLLLIQILSWPIFLDSRYISLY